MNLQRRLVSAAGAGLLAGLLSGLFGVGGGILMVPALVFIVGLDQRLAHGTSLAAVIPIAAASTVGYWTAGEVDWSVAALLAAGSVVGAVIGTQLLAVVPRRALSAVFIAILLATALRFLTESGDAMGRGVLTPGFAVLLISAGVIAGIMAGLLGVGGGSVLVPTMVVLVGMSTVTAKGTSLAAIVLTAVVGTWRNRANSNVDMRIAVAAGIAGVASAFLGGLVSVRMSDRTANLLFAGLLVVVASKMTWDLFRRRIGEPR